MLNVAESKTLEEHGDLAAAEVPLRVVVPSPGSISQPVTVGVPLPRGMLRPGEAVALFDAEGHFVVCQSSASAHWPDGSVKWLLLDFLTPAENLRDAMWSIRRAETANAPALRIREDGERLEVDTEAAEFSLDLAHGGLLAVRVGGRELLDADGGRVRLKEAKGKEVPALVEHRHWESRGPLRATLRLEGRFVSKCRCRFVARWCFFAGTGLLRLRLTIHNPKSAKHAGGLWDLGDPGSFLFRGLAVELPFAESKATIRWQTEPDSPEVEQAGGGLEVYQDSSGGENWQSRNHVNRFGRVPVSFRGYRVRSQDGEQAGRRASPVVALEGDHGTIGVAVPEFWQQFPKAIEVADGKLRVGLFPEQFADLHELQGGEQKTHTVWFHFDQPSHGTPNPLSWVHEPAHALPSAEWTAKTGVLPYLLSADTGGNELETYLDGAFAAPRSLLNGREIIDEYGWRHFGDLYADHEEEYYRGPRPILSHYNNQYDVVLGSLTQYLRSSDRRWWAIGDPLARHVVDIDIYHTRGDRAAYNGGLFWITDHYRDAGTATHRTFSRDNCPPKNSGSYGGGPGCEHNFTTGLALYYYLTGDTLARDAVVGLADWVIGMDDGRGNILGLVDDGPTGLASRTRHDLYHGPGRGVGNSINALLDGWLLTGENRYLAKAEELIRRAVHPDDDVAARDLLNAENRWSATIFFSVLDRYLSLKAEAGQLDAMYAYSRAAFVHYAEWLVEHERPYYDRPEQLEYPTETWAAQELRKANVLRLAARHADESLRSRLLRRGNELAERGWSDLQGFETRFSTRAVALVLAEGPREAFLRAGSPEPSPPPIVGRKTWDKPAEFVPQRERVRRQLRNPLGLARLAVRLANPAGWIRFFRSGT